MQRYLRIGCQPKNERMKYGIFAGLILFVLITPGFQCRENYELGPGPDCYKGKLEVKGLCMNYTISVVEGNIDTSKIQATWTDPTTNKTYSNVFGLLSYCSFPSNLNEGDEFYFTISEQVNNCGTCLVYYPQPSKRLYISVWPSCTQ
jgi:hypothetical protein